MAIVAIGGAARVRADVQIPFSPRVTATLSNGQESIEAGIERTIGGSPSISSAEQPGSGAATVTGGRLFLSLSLPFSSGTVVRVDRNTTDWRLNLGGDLAYRSRTEASDASDLDHSRSRYGLTLSAGHAAYTYFPGAGLAPQDESHWSVSGTARALWVHARRAELWAPQVAITYDRSYAASAPVGIVTPSEAGSPALVMRTVAIDPPTTSPTLTARVSCPLALWPDSQFLIGPSLSHAFTGGDREMSPFGGTSGRIEGELWIYYIPRLQTNPDTTNIRLGVAPFASQRTYGDDGQDRFAYGALVELRINTEIFDY